METKSAQESLEKLALFIGGSIGLLLGTALETLLYGIPTWIIFTVLLGFSISLKIICGWLALIVITLRIVRLLSEYKSE
jgi:hypothetical protein